MNPLSDRTCRGLCATFSGKACFDDVLSKAFLLTACFGAAFAVAFWILPSDARVIARNRNPIAAQSLGLSETRVEWAEISHGLLNQIVILPQKPVNGSRLLQIQPLIRILRSSDFRREPRLPSQWCL